MSEYEYRVASSSGRGGMITHDKSCRYSKEIEKQLLQAGYKIYVNGERLTSRSLSGTGKDE